jgi:hypothetical protein
MFIVPYHVQIGPERTLSWLRSLQELRQIERQAYDEGDPLLFHGTMTPAIDAISREGFRSTVIATWNDEHQAVRLRTDAACFGSLNAARRAIDGAAIRARNEELEAEGQQGELTGIWLDERFRSLSRVNARSIEDEIHGIAPLRNLMKDPRVFSWGGLETRPAIMAIRASRLLDQAPLVPDFGPAEFGGFAKGNAYDHMPSPDFESSPYTHSPATATWRDSLDLTGCVVWLSTDCPEGAEVYVATDDGLQYTPLVREEPVVALGM